MATATTHTADASRAELAAGDAGSIAAPAPSALPAGTVPGLSPEIRSAIDSAVRTGAELMRLRVLKILSAELDSVTALRIAEMVMRVEV